MMRVSKFHVRRLANRRRGAGLVEFAMILPVMIGLLTASVEFSRALMLQHTADTAAYEAARAGMVPGASVSDAEVEAEALLSAAGLTETLVTVTPEEITEETATITVVVEIPIAPNSWIAAKWLGALSVRSEVMLLTERSPIVRITGFPDLKKKADKMKGKAVNI